MPSRLIPLELPRPGIFGVNTSASGDVMPKEYSVSTMNMVFSDEGFLEARRGTRRDHTDTLKTELSAATDQTVRTVYHTRDENGDDLLIFSTEDGIMKIANNAITDITGTITAPSAGNWKFQNLNDKIIGFQPGHGMIELTTPSTGTFSDVTFTGTEAPATSGSAATDILAAAGRLWVLDGDQLRYSDQLDHTSFDPTGGDGGAFDLNASMLRGEDNRVALDEFNGNLLVFYEKHITVWSGIWNPNADTAVAELGASPAMQVVENISGVGCVARDSIQKTQNDLLFLSEQGVTSLSRVVQEKSMPLKRYSDNIRREILDLLQTSDMTKVWSEYLEGKGMYLLGHPDYKHTILIDAANTLEDGSHRCTLWDKVFTTMGVTPVDNLAANEDIWSTLYCSSEVNYLSKMKGHTDDALVGGTGGSSYDIEWESAWTYIQNDLANRIKIPKKIITTIKGSGTQTVGVNLAFDYGGFIDNNEKVFTVELARTSLYGSATYGGATTSVTTGYYGSGNSIKKGKGMGFGKGQIMKVRVRSTVDGFALSLQRVTVKAKVGRQ